MTPRDLIGSSLRILGVLASGEVPSANDLNDAFVVLNDMIDSWSNERLAIYSIVKETFPLVSGRQTYTMGIGGDFNTSRPMRIESALLNVTTDPTPYDLPIRIINRDEWNRITVKSLLSTYPMFLYPDYAYPLANLNFYCSPNLLNNVVLDSWKALGDFATVDDIVSFPPGYNRAFKYNLAIDLASEYGKTPTDLIVAIAASSKEVIKSKNSEVLYLSTDEALRVTNGGRTFNWLTGEGG